MIPTVDIQIRTVGAAFDPSPDEEIVRILRDLADKIERHGLSDYRLGPIHDLNGNRCGDISTQLDY